MGNAPTTINACNTNELHAALMVAILYGHVDVVRELIKYSNNNSNSNNNNNDAVLDMNAPDKLGCTPLMVASENGHINVVCELLNYKNVDMNAKDDDGHTALMVASMNGHSDVVCKLAKKEGMVDLNAETSKR